MAEHIRIEVDPRGVASLWLARAEKRNAMGAQMIAELTEAATDLGADPAVRVVILQAEGDVFCAGGDLGWMRDQMDADRATRMEEARKLADMLGALNQLPKPLIGAVTGNAFGGGVGLMSVCDTVIAAEHARFALTETRLGLIPATIGPYVIARLGPGPARRIFMSGRLFGAVEATALGLVGRVVPPEQLEAAVEAEITPYLKTAPGAVGAAKALIDTLARPVNEAQVTASITALADQWETAEAQAGIAAFFDKRPPPWSV